MWVPTVQVASALDDVSGVTVDVVNLDEGLADDGDLTGRDGLPASAERAGDASAGRQLDAALGALLAACQLLGVLLAPFVPGLAARLAAACDDSAGPLPEPRILFPRIG